MFDELFEKIKEAVESEVDMYKKVLEEWPDVQQLKKVNRDLIYKISNIENVVVHHVWYENRMPCFTVSFVDQSKKEWKLSFWEVNESVIMNAKGSKVSSSSKKRFINNLKHLVEESENINIEE